jgi:hypothetical protein
LIAPHPPLVIHCCLEYVWCLVHFPLYSRFHVQFTQHQSISLKFANHEKWAPVKKQFNYWQKRQTNNITIGRVLVVLSCRRYSWIIQSMICPQCSFVVENKCSFHSYDFSRVRLRIDWFFSLWTFPILPFFCRYMVDSMVQYYWCLSTTFKSAGELRIGSRVLYVLIRHNLWTNSQKHVPNNKKNDSIKNKKKKYKL